MKKHNTLFVVIITFLVIALLTWFIPVTYISNGAFTTDNRVPIGIGNLFNYPVYTFYNFIYVLIYLLLVGGLFGILKKLPAYRVMLDKYVERIKKTDRREKLFFILTIIIISIIVSLCGATYEALVLLPFLAALIYLLGYDGITTSFVMIGSIVAGVAGNTYSTTITGKLLSFTGTSFTDLILVKVILIILIDVLVIVFTLLHNKKIREEKIKVAENMFVPKKERNTENVKVWPLKLILGLGLLIVTLSTMSWASAFKVDIFDKFLTNMNSVLLFNKYIVLVIFGGFVIGYLLKYFIGKRHGKEGSFVKGFGICAFIFFVISSLIVLITLLKLFLEDVFNVTQIFTTVYNTLKFNEIYVGTLLGGVSSIGTWVYNQFIVWLLFIQVVIIAVYRINIKEAVENGIEGMKESLYPAFVCILSYSFLILLSNHQIILTGIKYLFTTNSSGNYVYINLSYPIATFVSGLLNTDFTYYEYGVFSLQDATGIFSDTSLYSLMILITQSMYGLAMLIAPSSVAMLYCLASQDISYKEWWKNVWKLFLALFALMLITFMIVLLVS